MDALAVAKPNASARFKLRLGVVTHVPHWVGLNGSTLAYEPYVREMRVWAELFSHVEICAPAAQGPIRTNVAPYDSTNVEWSPVDYNWLPGTRARINRFLQLPGLALGVKRLIDANDLILIRSPGHPAFIGNLLVRMTAKQSITKWAGLFDSFAGERLTSRLERRLLNLSGKRHPVLIYGPSQRSHLVSFLPALMTTNELRRAAQLSARRQQGPPWRFLSVGGLNPAKGFELAIRGLGVLRKLRPELEWSYVLAGDGMLANELRELAQQSGIADRTHFKGALPFAQVQEEYANAHLLIMPGVKEGWPKTIAEAWAHGAIPVAASAGLVPWILADGGGTQFDPTPGALAQTLVRLLDDRARMEEIQETLPDRASELSLESFRSRLQEVLVDYCGLEMNAGNTVRRSSDEVPTC